MITRIGKIGTISQIGLISIISLGILALANVSLATDPISVISSISPNPAQRGVTTLLITGTNLTNQVRFYDGAGLRYSGLGQLNAAKTQTTILVPAALPVGNATVKIYYNGTDSNGKLLKINGASTTPPTPTPTPTPEPKPAVDAARGWQGGPAFDSKNNKWLVVAHTVTSPVLYIEGRIMGSDGNPVGDVFRVNAASSLNAWSPLVSYSPDADKFLVVWTEEIDRNNWNTYGRFVSSDKTLGSQFQLNLDHPLFSEGADRESALRYDSKNKKFVLIWRYVGGGRSAAVITTVSLSGVMGPIVEVATGTQSTSNRIWGPSIAVNEDRNEYCAIYDFRDTSKWGTAKINASNLSVGTKSLVNTLTLNVDIAYNSQTKKYLAMYDTSYTSGVKGKILNSCSGTDGGNVFTIKAGTSASTVTYNPRSNNFAVIGQNDPAPGNGYAILCPSGTVLKTGNLFTTGYSKGVFLPNIAPNINDGSFGATSSRDYGMTQLVVGLLGGSGCDSGGGGGGQYNPYYPPGLVCNPPPTDLNKILECFYWDNYNRYNGPPSTAIPPVPSPTPPAICTPPPTDPDLILQCFYQENVNRANQPPQTTPQINSLNVSSAKVGSNLVITGLNLTTTVQFYKTSGGRYTSTGTLNAAKTQTSITIPSNLPVGEYSVKIYADAVRISNGKPLTVSN